MLVHVGDDRSVEVDLLLATFLAAIAGAINAAGFRAVGFFSANMTGNVSSLSYSGALSEWHLAAFFLGLISCFIAGSFISALLIEAGRRRKIAGIYAFSIMFEALILAGLAIADVSLPAIRGDLILVLGLSFVMGIQNAASTRISDARVRTTHVSGMATDIGIELAVLIGGAKDADDRPVVRSRFKLHAMTFLAFLVGGFAGVIAHNAIGSGLFMAIAAILLVISVPEARRARGRST